jgi:ribulose 1,5-bisphosphate synthetase/thiazole synthase
MTVVSSELPVGQTLQFDVCVVGSGPAGLTLVRETAVPSARRAKVAAALGTARGAALESDL